MYFPDLSVYTYRWTEQEPKILNVGWLDPAHPFPLGQPAAALVEALRVLVAKPVQVTRGFHVCEFCPDSLALQHEDFRSERAREVRGNGEIRVVAGGIEYAAPVLVRHYVEAHHYQPPTVFVEACRAAAANLRDS